MIVERLSNNIDTKKLLTNLGVDGGGVSVLNSKMQHYILHIKDLHVGAANILKQDALSIGADLAVPRGTVIATTPRVDCILIATKKHLKILSKKELAQPFGLKELAHKLGEIIKVDKPRHVEIMGVINANEDSFFNASRFQDSHPKSTSSLSLTAHAITKIQMMIEDGADIIDIGGVSSRPGATSVSVEEELQRVKPILNAIKENKLYEKTKFSIDSFTPSVIAHAMDSGFKIVNDITGLADDEVCKLCASYNATAVIMHMQGNPQTMQDNPKYESLLTSVYGLLQNRIQKAESFGVSDIIIDVGIGFGKTLGDNLSLIRNLEHFLTLNKKILVGASRKSMIDKIHPSSVDERLSGTITLHLEALKNGASMLRVHDVKEHVQALKVQKALESL